MKALSNMINMANMINIEVNAEHRYTVSIGSDWREEIARITQNHSKIFIVAPQSLRDLLALDGTATHSIYYSPDGESQKSYETLVDIWDSLAAAQIGRKDAIIGIGGGATTDLAGFAAATWLRGIDWYAIPTTLAAMVDASVGGKTGINTPAGKNLVGAFHSPQSVSIDLSFLSTLSDRDFSAGLAEVIKTGIIADESILQLLESAEGVEGARAHSADLIAKSVAVKARVVSSDFKEGKLREILNFGHTFGHAIEKFNDYSLRHGEAVSIGIMYALFLSESLAQLPSTQTKRIAQLLEKYGLPTKVSVGTFEALFLLMQGDKKVRAEQLRFVGVSEVGNPVWFEGVERELAKTIYERILQ